MTVMDRRDQFPIGMRVLAVDDDPTCLKVLESLLHRCQYHVTATNQAIKALELLRENKDQFDLVISDVHMPDMDGFKLLELVGLEMDLPVIMLSANGETQAVMKGITHGACDYLLKPVRYEELKNIWQHVIRRKKIDPRDQNNFDSGDDCDKNQLTNSEGAQSKINRKRKDQCEEDEDDGESNLQENEDSSTQKKPRVVWSVDLHRKFVAAVNQLGIDKAVPKRILDLMNVDGLTRENVASHLQKYRLYLKRLSAVANQQANMVAALRGRDPSYLPIGSLEGYSNFNSLVGSRPLQSNGSLPRMNTFTGFGLHGFVPSATRTLNNTNNSINEVGKIQGVNLPIQAMQQPKLMQESNKCLLGSFSTNPYTNVTKNPIRMPPPLSSDPFEISINNSSHSADLGRCNETWQSAVSSSNSYAGSTMSIPFSHNDATVKTNLSPMASNVHNQPSCLNEDANLFSFRSTGDSNNLKWEDPVQRQFHNANLMHNSPSNSSISNIYNGYSNKKSHISIVGQTSYSAPLAIHDSKSERTSVGTQLNYKDGLLFDDMKLPNGFGSSGFGLDDLVTNAMIKPECDDFTFIDGDAGCNDLYSLGACM